MTSARVATLVLIAATILAYVNCFSTVFQFDDRATILEDPRLAGLSEFTVEAGQMIRPFLKLSFLIDRKLYGQNPAGYHLINVLLHCGGGLLLFAILRRACTLLPGAVGCQPSAVSLLGVPFLTALLFLLHPIQTETVTYISGRPTGTAGFFCLLSLFLFLRAAEASMTGKGFAAYYGGALLSFVLALLSKETAVILPALLLLCHAIFRPPVSRNRAVCLHIPFWGLICLAFVAVVFHPRYSFLAEASLETRPVYTNLLTQINAVCHAFTLFVVPTRLNFDHDLPVFTSVTQWPLPICLTLLAAILATGLWSVRRRPLLAFGILWFFICLLPANSFIPRYDILSERNLYLPSIGIFLVVAWLFGGARRMLAPRLVGLICVLIAAALLIFTINRNRVYSDQVTFWSDAVRKSPQKARPHNNLGYALYEIGEIDRALDEFRTALSLDPESASARENLRRAWKIKHGAGY